jgi:hypothetical protein
MTADKTINSIVFVKRFDEKNLSERSSIARGTNTPDVMTVQGQEYVDSKTKVKGNRFKLGFDRVNVDSVSGQRYVSSFYLVLAVPELMVSADTTALLATFRAAVAESGLLEAVLNGEK